MTKSILLLSFIISALSTSLFNFRTYQNLLNQDNSYEGQVAIVTGGSTGIGYATALLLAQKGAQVVFCARDSHPTWYNGSSAEIRIRADPQVQAARGNATFFKADITKAQQVRDLINFTHQKYGKIDVAIFNAGIGGWGGRIDTLPDDVLFSAKDPIFNNLYGGINCVKEQTKYWMTQGNPNNTYSIVMLTSFQGFRGCESCDLYSISKHGIIGLIRSTSLEFATTSPKIRINGVAPGLTDTFLTRNQVKPNPDEGEAITENSPLWLAHKDEFAAQLVSKRLAEPVEQAAGIVFLASKSASYISGAVLNIDNGDFAK